MAEPDDDVNPLGDYARILARELLAPEAEAKQPRLRKSTAATVAIEQEEPVMATNGVAPRAHKPGFFARLLDRRKLTPEGSAQSPTAPRVRSLSRGRRPA
jgi:hypothetical protein